MIKKNNYGLYFLNNLYDDNIVNDFIGNFRNRLYTDILDGKKFIQKNVFTNGNISEFKIDNDFNRSHDFPYGSYHMTIPYDIVPYYSETDFVKNYKFDTPISSTTVMKDTHIFTKAVYFFIGGYYIYDIKFIFNKHTFTVVIPNTNDFATVLMNEVNGFEDKTWSLMWVSKSDYYYAYLSRVNLIDGNKIYVSKLTDKKIFNKKKSNYWTLYLSANTNYPNKMLVTDVTYVEDVNGDYFLLPDEFISYAYNLATSMKCLIVNNPECRGSGVYLDESGTTPIFQIPYVKNPIPVDNLVVWKYDSVTKRKLYPMVVDVDLTYPNIYDFSRMLNGVDAYIEWLEPINDISAFDSYLKNYMDCYGSNYATMITNRTADQRVLDFKPIDFIDFSAENYFKSEYYGDNRAWRLSKLLTILKDNPNRYEELLEHICYLNREFVSMSYNYETDAHIYERSIMSTREHCDNADERLVNFKEPHTFIKTYNSSCENRYCTLFINGVKKDVTCDMTFGSDMYVYFPVSYIENHEDIQLVVYLDNTKVVDQTFENSYSGGYYDYEDPEELLTNSLADLVYYDDWTKEFIDPSFIKYRLRVETFDFKYNGYENLDEYAVDSYKVLYSNNDETIQPTNYDFIILSARKEVVDIPGTNYHKKINMKDVEFSIPNPKYDGCRIHVASTSFYTIRTFDVTDEMVNNGFTLTIDKFKGKYMKTRYHLYLDGRIINPNLYDIKFPKKYGGNVEIINPKFGSGKVTVEYISYDELVVFNGKVGDLKKTYDNILYLDDILDLPLDIDMYSIYIDGYRIHNDQIRKMGQNNMITIHTNREFTDDSEILIYTQQYDEDPYEYETSLHFLSEVSKTDDTFRSYLLETFDK